MGSNSVDGSTGHGSIVAVALLLIVLGVFGVFATLPRSQLEDGSGTGNYGLPGHGNGTTSQGGTSGTSTSAPGGNTAIVTPTTVDILVPANDTADDSP